MSVTCRTWPILTRYSCSSCCRFFIFIFYFLQPPWYNLFLSFWSIFQGHLILGNVTVLPYFLHLVMMAFTVFHSASDFLVWYPSPDLYLLTMRFLTSCKLFIDPGFSIWMKLWIICTETLQLICILMTAGHACLCNRATVFFSFLYRFLSVLF